MSKWPMVKLGEVCLPVSCISSRYFSEHEEFRYIDIAAVDRDIKSITGSICMNSDEAPSRARQLVLSEDIIVSTVRPNLNAVGIVNSKFDGAIASTGFCVLRPNKEKVKPGFLFTFTRSKYFIDYVSSRATGASYPAVSDKIINACYFPLPPLAEQTRIVELLDRAQNLIDRRKEQLSLMDALIQSLFYDMFGDPVKNEKGWETEAVENVCKFIYGGGTPSTLKPEYFTGDIPWVSPKDMKTKWISTSIDKITKEAVENSSTKLVEQGAVLMVIRSGILKRTLPVAINTVPVTLNQDMKAFITDGAKVYNEFLLYIFIAFESVLLGKVRAVTADNIEFEQIKKMRIPVPPLTKQRDFSAKVQQIESSKQRMSASLAELEQAFNSLMQEAFNG